MGGNLFNPSSQHDYGLVQNNPMGGKDVDGYFCVFNLGPSCNKNKQEAQPAPSQPQQQSQPQPDPAALSTINRVSPGSLLPGPYSCEHTVSCRQRSLNAETNKMNDQQYLMDNYSYTSSYSYQVQRVYIPSIWDYQGTSEKLFNDTLSSNIAVYHRCRVFQIYSLKGTEC